MQLAPYSPDVTLTQKCSTVAESLCIAASIWIFLDVGTKVKARGRGGLVCALVSQSVSHALLYVIDPGKLLEIMENY